MRAVSTLSSSEHITSSEHPRFILDSRGVIGQVCRSIVFTGFRRGAQTMRHPWKKSFDIKCLSPFLVYKTPESNMSLIRSLEVHDLVFP